MHTKTPSVKRACQACHKDHKRCSLSRPCDRCKKKGIPCVDQDTSLPSTTSTNNISRSESFEQKVAKSGVMMMSFKLEAQGGPQTRRTSPNATTSSKNKRKRRTPDTESDEQQEEHVAQTREPPQTQSRPHAHAAHEQSRRRAHSEESKSHTSHEQSRSHTHSTHELSNFQIPQNQQHPQFPTHPWMNPLNQFQHQYPMPPTAWQYNVHQSNYPIPPQSHMSFSQSNPIPATAPNSQFPKELAEYIQRSNQNTSTFSNQNMSTFPNQTKSNFSNQNASTFPNQNTSTISNQNTSTISNSNSPPAKRRKFETQKDSTQDQHVVFEPTQSNASSPHLLDSPLGFSTDTNHILLTPSTPTFPDEPETTFDVEDENGQLISNNHVVPYPNHHHTQFNQSSPSFSFQGGFSIPQHVPRPRFSTQRLMLLDDPAFLDYFHSNRCVVVLNKAFLMGVYEQPPRFYGPGTYFCNQAYANLLGVPLNELVDPTHDHTNLGIWLWCCCLQSNPTVRRNHYYLLQEVQNALEFKMVLQRRGGSIIFVKCRIHVNYHTFCWCDVQVVDKLDNEIVVNGDVKIPSSKQYDSLTEFLQDANGGQSVRDIKSLVDVSQDT